MSAVRGPREGLYYPEEEGDQQAEELRLAQHPFPPPFPFCTDAGVVATPPSHNCALRLGVRFAAFH